MIRTKLASTIAVLALLAAACSVSSSSESSTTLEPDGAATTTSTVLSEPTTTLADGTDREVNIARCGDSMESEIEPDVAIVCEVFDLIRDRYVDEISEADLLAAAEAELSDLDGADSSGLLVCAVPTDDFVATCDLAATRADDSAEAAEAMVNGFVAALDPNSGYLDAQALALQQEEQLGEVQGIGALVSSEDQTIEGDNKQCSVISETCQIAIISPISGSPAEAAGLVRDDVIVGVDSESILGWTVDEVTSAVRGPAGTQVTLTIEREGGTMEVTIIRAAVSIPVIEEDVFGDVGYVRLNSFTGNAGSQFESAIVDVLSQGVDELVIDLRGNPGGFLDTAIDVASVFMADGDVVETVGPNDSNIYPVNGDAIIPQGMVVTFALDKGSASASEVVSAVLQERGLAIVVGENSFGKNTVQQRFSLSNGGAMRLTIARWLTPGGLDFGGVGVTPDIELDVADLAADELVAAIQGL